MDAKKFARWRKACEEQLARGNPFLSHEPGCKDVIAMIDKLTEPDSNDLRPDEWVTVWAGLKSRAHSLREMAGEPRGLSDETRKNWSEEADRLDAIVAKLGAQMGQM